jgi:lipopolysaccharide transport system permease protein
MPFRPRCRHPDVLAPCIPIRIDAKAFSTRIQRPFHPKMIALLKNLYAYRDLIRVLAWKNISLRYKQAYLGIAWAIFKPVMLMLIFTLVRSLVGIDSGDIPYPVLVFAALMPWTFFQESVSDGINSIVGNTALIRKIYFPREVLPLTSVTTKLVELGINVLILTGLLAWYRMVPGVHMLWAPLLILYTVLAALTVVLVGAALNVYFRDIGAALPVVLSLLMYASPVMYPLQLVKDKLLTQQAAGAWSDLLYMLYTLNPLAGIIDGFQSAVLRNQQPEMGALIPGAVLVMILLPLSYHYFKHAERHFADAI